jgi:ADP-heptose:LPS heptosyltransferase
VTGAILVIRLGALGDFIQSAGPFAAIRAHHAGAPITLLTTPPFADFAAASPWFDQVWVDRRPKLWQVGRLLDLRRRLRGGGFERVYDLQTSDRSSFYRRLVGGAVEWSGIARGCSHPHANPARNSLHTLERQAEQLAMAGVSPVEPPDLSWVRRDPDRFALPERFVLLCPGGAAHRPGKRWPAERFAALAAELAAGGAIPVVLGTASEAREVETILAACPQALSLVGRTDLFDLVALGRRAAVAVGNDTGPMHALAAAGCPGLVLFSQDSDPALCAPRGRMRVLQRPVLAELGLESVKTALAALT